MPMNLTFFIHASNTYHRIDIAIIQTFQANAVHEISSNTGLKLHRKCYNRNRMSPSHTIDHPAYLLLITPLELTETETKISLPSSKADWI